jgi:transcriptional regulator with XRE-family HTH domain
VFVGDKIRKLRTERGLSLMHLGRLTGLDPQTIRRCEVVGQVTPRSARRLAAALHCSPEEFSPRDLRGKWGRE